MNQDQVKLAALAGLLHDIGKLSLRAGINTTQPWNTETKRTVRKRHALHTADVVNRIVPESWRISMRDAAVNHHHPQTHMDRVVALADTLSKGSEADFSEDDELRRDQPRQTLAVFSSVTADDKQTEPAYLPLKELKLERDVLFPQRNPWEEDKVWQHYTELWKSFIEDADKLYAVHQEGNSLNSYMDSLLMLLQRILWCVPSGFFNRQPDVNLYDHSRMTAALSAILINQNAQDIEAVLASPRDSTKTVALLVGGDISGVQDFIYTITARGATSALRGRSFYLQLLTEAVARFLLKRLDLPLTNLIYVGGGNFYILARPEDQHRIPQVQQEISRTILHHHRGELYLAVATELMPSRDFFDGRVGQTWGRLAEKSERVKQKRFVELAQDIVDVFAVTDLGGDDIKQCQVCGLEHAHTRSDEDDLQPDETVVRKCPPCLSYEELGKALRKANWLCLDEIPQRPLNNEPPGSWSAVLAHFGLQAELYESTHEIPAVTGASRTLLALKDNLLPTARPSRNVAIGRRHLVNVTPVLQADDQQDLPVQHNFQLPKVGDVKPFDLLSKQSNGIDRLGVLRMDVDNLGKLFAEGLGERATLSRLVSLSFAVSLYFEGWTGVLAEKISRQNEKGTDRLYSIYSGGDDLFFVGSWDAVVELAIRIRADLTPFAANHPGIHASAGITLIGGKSPLAHAALKAGAAEEQAKSLIWWGDDKTKRRKDAISFLGEALPWYRFGIDDCKAGLSTAHGLMHWLVALHGVEQSSGATPLIRRMSALYEQYKESKSAQLARRGVDVNWSGQSQADLGPWAWRTVYTLSRYHSERHKNEIEKLKSELQSSEFRTMEWIGLAARWAELLLRHNEAYR